MNIAGNGIVLPESARCCRGKVITLDNYRCPSPGGAGRWSDVINRGRGVGNGEVARAAVAATRRSIPVVTRRRENVVSFFVENHRVCGIDVPRHIVRKVAHDGVAVLDRAGHETEVHSRLQYTFAPG